MYPQSAQYPTSQQLLQNQNYANFQSTEPSGTPATQTGASLSDTLFGALSGIAGTMGGTLAKAGVTPGEDTPQTLGARTGGGTGYSAEDIQMLDASRSLYERLLQSIDAAERNGLTSLQDSENSARNNATTQRQRALEDFGMQRQDSERGKEGALNRVGDNSRMLRDSLMRRLGLGAGGGSAFQMGDQAVAREASKNRTGVLNSYGENDRNLSLSERRADEDYNSLLEEIMADRRSKEQALKTGILGQRQGITQSLAEIAADKARAIGGSQIDAAAPYQSRYIDYQNQIDQMPSQYRTTVDARALNVQTPTLRDYVVDRAAINQSKQSGQQQYSPYSAFLNRGKDEESRMM